MLTVKRCRPSTVVVTVCPPSAVATDILHVLHHDAVARQGRPVRRHLEIVAADAALGIGGRRSRHRLQNLLDLLGELVDLDQIGSDHLDADRRADTGRQHVDARLDRHGPGVRHARKLQRFVHLRNQPVDCHAGAPLLLRLEVDHGLEHLGRRRIGRGRRAPRLAVDRGHFRKRADDAILHLHQFAGLCDRDAGQCRRHVEQCALVQIGHEFGAKLPRRPDASRKHANRDHHRPASWRA